MLKYEFRRHIGLILAALGAIVASEAYALISLYLKDEMHITTSVVTLIVVGFSMMGLVFAFSIRIYEKELTSTEGLLTFMTPISVLKVLLGKFLATFLMGAVAAGLLAGAVVLNIAVAKKVFPEMGMYQEILDMVIQNMEMVETVSEFVAMIAAAAFVFLASYFSWIAIAYLATTLSSTWMRNKKGRWAVAFALFFAFSYLLSFVNSQVGGMIAPEGSAVGYNWTPYYVAMGAISLVFIVLSVWGSTVLLKKYVDF